MDSIDKECNPVKHEYDSCFNKWYTEEFLSGKYKALPDGEEPCSELFKKYKTCLMRGLKAKNMNVDELVNFSIIGTTEEKKPPEGAENAES